MYKAIYWLVAGILIGVVTIMFSAVIFRAVWVDGILGVYNFNFNAATLICIIYGVVALLLSWIFKLIFHR